TLGATLAPASPSGEAAPVLLALDAELTLASPTATRRLPLQDFFRGYRQHVLAAQELIVSVHIPKPWPTIQRFYKVSKRELDDISTVAAAFALALDAKGHVLQLRAAYGGVAATPLRLRELEALARGRPWDGATVRMLQAALASAGTPLTDHRGSAEYRRALLGQLLEKLFVETAEAAT
ncbi:MAG: FAD binding domain-containing protein, partial [Polyangiales bacterium]